MLDDILKVKEQEVQIILQTKKNLTAVKIVHHESFISNLKGSPLLIIAEIKRKSPSSGAIALVEDPTALARKYVEGGASAISVLTDKTFFNGSFQDLKDIHAQINIPLLRKDFIIHPVQIIESVEMGASAVLLIAAVLGDKLKSMIDLCTENQLDALVEVHDKDEINLALDVGAKIIGVNNRNLKTMTVSLDNAENLSKFIPSTIIKVAESGIKTLGDALRMKEAGYHAILVGESLVRAENPEILIEQLRSL